MSEPTDVAARPLVAAVSAAGRAMTAGLGALVVTASEEDLRVALREVSAVAAQCQAAVLVLTREAAEQGVCERDGASTPAMWLHDQTRVDPAVARRLVRLGAALAGTCPVTQAALAGGALSAAHARVVTEVVAGLPGQAAAGTVRDAEVFLVEQARVLCPRDLAGLGRELHEQVAGAFPSVDDPGEAAAVERAADHAALSAWERRGLEVYERDGGEVALRGSLAGDDAAALVTWLEASAQPTPAADGVVDERTATQRRADALTCLVTATLDAGTLPAQGGNRPQVILTVALETLHRMARTAVREPDDPGRSADGEAAMGAVVPQQRDRGLDPGDRFRARAGDHGAWARLDTGTALAPGDLRRVLCDARITPVVMDGASQPLDVGRDHRLITPAIRNALTARDRGCTWPGCRTSPRAAHAHHLTHWIDGGTTSVTNACLLCHRHHQQLHKQGWLARLAPNGYPELLPPAFLDPLRRPRQHARAAMPTPTTMA